MKIAVFRDEVSLAPHLARWRELARGIPFRQPEWLLSWWHHFQESGTELSVFGALDEDGVLRGLLPLYWNSTNKELRLLGDRTVCTDHLGVLLDDSFVDVDMVDLLAQTLCQNGPEIPSWQRMVLEGVSNTEPTIDRLVRGIVARRGHYHTERPTNLWTVSLPDGWSAFVQSVSKNSRKLFRKRCDDLEHVRVKWVFDRADLVEFFPILIELHQKRRTALGDPGCFADRKFENFLKEASVSLLACNQLQAFSLWMDGKPISADIGYRSSHRWFCYQAGIDPDAMEHEPGKLANIMILRDAEKFGIHEVDFLRGDEPYKQQLKANPTPLQDVVLHPPGYRGWLGRSSSVASIQLRNWVKRIRRARGN